MKHMVIAPQEKNEKHLQSIKLSIFDALKLCHAEVEKNIIFTESSPILGAYIKDDNIEFITDDGEKIIYNKCTVTDAVNKHYYIGQKYKSKH